MKHLKIISTLILSTLILSSCGMQPSTLNGITKSPGKVERGLPQVKYIPVEDQYYKEAPAPLFLLENVSYEKGIISYDFVNKSLVPISYGEMFILEYFTSKDVWEDTKYTHHLRGTTVLGQNIEDVELAVMPNISIKEKLDISPYLSKLNNGTYHTLKYFVDDTTQVMHKVTIQFVKDADGSIGHVYGFIDEFPLTGNPLNDIIPAPEPIPVITSPIEDDKPQDTADENADSEIIEDVETP